MQSSSRDVLPDNGELPSYEPEDEHTPLISRSVDQAFRNPFRGRNPLRNSLPNFPRYLRSRSSSSTSSASDDGRVDINSLRLSLARVGSVPSSSVGLDPSRLQWYEHERPSFVKIGVSDRIPEAPVEAEIGNVQEEDALTKEQLDSKFIGVSPTQFWLVFSVIMIGYIVACFDSTLMASSHPVITSYFNASQSASWLSTVFLITSTSFQPLFGRLSDTIGRKPVFMLSFLIFGLTTLWCALAQSIESFIAARAVCGLGAGGVMSLCLIIVSDLVRIEDRGIYQSHLNFAFGLGSASGAAFGGFLCDSLGWRYAFGIQVPLLAVAFVAAFFCTPSGLGPMLINAGSDGGRPGGDAWAALKNFDSVGSLFLLISVTSLILALNLGGNIFPWLSAIVLASFSIFLVSSTILCLVERRATQPVMPLRLLLKPPIANLVFANFLGGIASNTILFNVPLFFQAVLLTSPTSSGFRLAVPSLAGSAAGISTGYIITYTRRLKPTLVLGAVIYLAGSIAMIFIGEKVSELASVVLITGVPLGQGFVFPNSMMSALAVSEQADQAVVTTTVGLWRSLGVVLGVAASSLVFQNTLVANLERAVQGVDKQKTIEKVRSSVGAIRALPEPYRGQVINAYAASLRTTFACAVIASLVMVLIVVPIKLPKLKKGGRKIAAPAGE